MQTPEEFAWTLYEAMDFWDHYWHDKDATSRLIAARDEAIRADERAKVEQLRAGLEALADKWDDPPCQWESPGYYGAYYDCANDIRDLLNPTEGETDE